MCGIAGSICIDSPASTVQLEAAAARMATALTPRGPDDLGTWTDAKVGVALGFRRLSIVDLSPAGHQPMMSKSGRFVIVFNGEIYNHRELRVILQKENISCSFRGHSDSEVLLAGIERWGLEETIKKSVGMFAIALWDRHERVLHLARDRMGEKPLYYGLSKRTLLFGSELKALQAHKDFDGKIDRDALQLFMRHGYLPAPHTIYDGFYKLTPGSILSLDQNSIRSGNLPTPVAYWSAHAAAIDGQQNPLLINDNDAINELEQLIKRSISQQILADVPVGAFLSGGVDSSAVVAIMQSLSHRPVKTFSIGFHETSFNEATHAKSVAKHLGTDHTELYVTTQDAMSVLTRLPEIYDEPFADSSQIPTFLVSKLAKQDVTVSLSGDGGDELFEGYPRYACAARLWRLIRFMPNSLKGICAHALRSRSLACVAESRLISNRAAQKLGLPARMDGKLARLARVVQNDSIQQVYRSMVSYWSAADSVILNANESYSALGDLHSTSGIQGLTPRLRFLDQIGYLPDDILAKVDRAAMSVGLETRVPLLDHRIVEFSWRLPQNLLRRHRKNKWILKQVLHRYVPEQLVDRPKMGFGIPIGMWMRGPLRDWAEHLLNVSRMNNDGFLNVPVVRRRWEEHVSGKRDWQYHLWSVLMFQMWREHALASISNYKCAA